VLHKNLLIRIATHVNIYAVKIATKASEFCVISFIHFFYLLQCIITALNSFPENTESSENAIIQM